MTRLLNSPIAGALTEKAASSWMERLGGVSRGQTLRIPPCLAAAAWAVQIVRPARIAVASATDLVPIGSSPGCAADAAVAGRQPIFCLLLWQRYPVWWQCPNRQK